MAIDSGVSCEVIERLKNDMNFSTCSDSQKMVSVMLDEMKIKSGLVINRHILFKTTNPFDASRNVYYFCDVPHLLKTARNCFSNSLGHSYSRKLKVHMHAS